MQNDSTKDRFSRRGFLGVGSAALATVAGSLAVSSTFAQENPAIKIGTDRSATDPGPSNDPLDKQNPDSECHPLPIPRAWFKTSNIRSLLRTSGLTKEDGHGK